jgi:hypothetical protein
VITLTFVKPSAAPGELSDGTLKSGGFRAVQSRPDLCNRRVVTGETIMKTFKKVLGVVAMTLALGLTACQKSSDSTNTNQRYTRNSSGFNSATGGCNLNSNTGYGAIWGGSYSSVLPYFMVNVTNLGYVSGQSANDSTGLRMYGQVSKSTLQGTIVIEVWDNIAAQSCSPFRMSFQVVPSSSSLSSGVITAQDSDGVIQFQAQELDNSYFAGQLQFQNNDSAGGASGSLGVFKIPTSYLFTN